MELKPQKDHKPSDYPNISQQLKHLTDLIEARENPGLYKADETEELVALRTIKLNLIQLKRKYKGGAGRSIDMKDLFI